MAGKFAGRAGRRYRRARVDVLLAYGGICHICGHGGARSVDHTPSLKVLRRLGLDPDDPRFMRPAHGIEGCSVCPWVDGKPRRCNQSKGDRQHARVHTSASW